MKKLSLFLFLLASIAVFLTNAQPVQITHVDFEAGLPSGWTVSGDISLNTVLVGSGTQSCKLKPSANQTIFTSPTITRTAGRNVRLEFSHIPMLKNLTGGVGGGKVEISVDGGNSWTLLSSTGSPTSPTTYDASYGSGIQPFYGSFRKIDYYKDSDPLVNIPEADMDKSYWRNEVFYLGNSLGSATSFKIRFIVPVTPAADQFSGWYIDDIRVTEAASSGNTVRIPQINSFNTYPNHYNLPNCNDVLVSVNIGFLGSSAPTNNDSIYIEYKYNQDTEISRVSLIKNTTNNAYEGYIPFNGYDSLTHWKLVVNDNIGNKVTYPYVYNSFNEYVSLRGFVGEFPMATSGLSNQEIMLRTNKSRNLTQMRYRASELRAVGYEAGHIESLVYNVTQATTNFTMNGFNVYIASISPGYALNASYQYSEHYTHVHSSNLVAPQMGWRVISFDEPYMWDGESDLLIKVCWDNTSGTGGTTKIECFPAPGASGSVPAATSYQFYQTGAGSTNACGAPFNISDGALNYRPNFKFRFTNSCQLKHDVGITNHIIAPNTYVVQANTPSPVRVRLKNYGTDEVNSAIVTYQIDDNPSQTVGTWNGSLASGDSANYLFTSNITFDPGYRYMKSWTQLVHPLIDFEPMNDTGYFEIISCDGPMSGEYAIGNVPGISAGRKFNSFREVFKMLVGCGVSGPVTIKIDPQGQYADSLIFPTNIPGISSSNHVTFKSSTNSDVVIKVDKVYGDVINLSGVKHLRFENLRFNSPDSIFTVSNVIRMNSATNNIQFKNVSFYRTIHSMKPNAYVYVGEANDIVFDSCTFNGNADYQIYIKGASPMNLSSNVTIKNSSFTQNLDNAIFAEYTSDLSIEDNVFKNYRAENASTVYNIIIQSSKDVYIERNEILLNNVSAIGLSGMLASNTNSLIANNMISVSNNNTGSSTTNISAINMLSGQNVQIAYNNIYARDQGNLYAYGLNLGISGQVISDVEVKNNVVVSDGMGQAVYTRPISPTSIIYSNNVYWKEGTMVNNPSQVIWRYNTTSFTSLEQWRGALMGGDDDSYVENPLFVDWNNLNTSNAFLCYKGIEMVEVEDDFYGESRPTTGGTCIGALQFDPPPSNIYVKEVWIEKGEYIELEDGSDSYSACGLGQEYLKVRFANISQNSILPNTLALWYRIDNLPVPPLQKDTIDFEVESNIDYVHTFSLPYNFAATNQDREFKVRAFSVLSADPIKTNDTAVCYINSRYQLSALPDQNITINYGDSALLSITSNDSIYWFLGEDEEIPVLKSANYQTEKLFADTTFYFSRKEEIPNLKISEIQFTRINNPEGITPDLPSWVVQNCAIELSNFGNGDINLQGYKVEYYMGNPNLDSLNVNSTRNFVFPNYTLPANSAVVLQYGTSNQPTDSLQTIFIGSGNFNSSSKLGFTIKDSDGDVVEALTVNGIRFRTTHEVPSNVWSGYGKMMTDGTAGIIRTSSSITDSTAWIPASESTPMSLGTLNTNLVTAFDNGCLGFKSAYNVLVSGIPTVDPGISNIELSGIVDEEVCTLGLEEIVLRIYNTGVSTLAEAPVLINLYDQDSLCLSIEDTCFVPINSGDTITYLVSQPIDLSSHESNRSFIIEAISNLSTDVINTNDTIRMGIVSRHTPIPPLSDGDTIEYGTTAFLTTIGDTDNQIIWYDDQYTTIEAARGDYTTEILYASDTFYVSEKMEFEDVAYLGDATSLSAAGPSPINPSNKHVKEQYLIRGSELEAIGMTEGIIKNIAFHIERVIGNFEYPEYRIRIGTTEEETLTAWETNLTEVYYSTTDTIMAPTASDDWRAADTGWRVYNFDTPFYYDGVSNIVVEVCHHVERVGTGGFSSRTYYTQTDYHSVIFYRNNVNPACEWEGNPQAASFNRPNFKFDVNKYGCSSERTAVHVEVAPPPACDAGIIEIASPNTTTVMSGIDVDIDVRIKNYGAEPLVNPIIAWTINDDLQTPYQYPGTIPANQDTVINIATTAFTSGVIELMAWTEVDCDTIYNDNDTASFSFSACIGNSDDITTLSIGGASADYPDFNSAIDALLLSGVCGHVVFEVNPITNGYNEQIYLSSILGASSESTITFRGNTADSNDVVLTYGSAELNKEHVVWLEDAAHIRFENFRIEAYGDSSIVVVDLENTKDIKFRNMVIAAKEGDMPNREITSLLSISGESKDIVIDGTQFIHGAYSLSCNESSQDSITNLDIINSNFNSYAFGGISAYRINNLTLKGNKVRQYRNQNISKAVYISSIYGQLDISYNDIHIDSGMNARTGIEIKRFEGDYFNPGLVYNNAIGMYGTKTTGTYIYNGINIDSVENLNIFYNTVNLFPSVNSANSRALNIGMRCDNIKVLNNNLSNNARGYALYVFNPSDQVSLSNNNNYYTTGLSPVFWTGNKMDLAAVQAANGMDANSVMVPTPFVSDSVLELNYPSGVVRMAEPLDDVYDDFFHRFRPVSPKPSIGAFEYQFVDYDAGVVAIHKPERIRYIEGLPLEVEARVKNFGLYTIDTIQLTAFIKYHREDEEVIESITETFIHNLPSLAEQDFSFSEYLYPPLNLNVLDSLSIGVFTTVGNDTIARNDTLYSNFLSIPGYNLQAVSTVQITERCQLFETEIAMNIKSTGENTINPGDSIWVGYEVDGRPDLSARELLLLPYTQVYPVVDSLQKNEQFTYTFNTRANFYPQGLNDTIWRLRTYVSLRGDNVPGNDTTMYINVNSRVSPERPIMNDTSIHYGTWAKPWGTQVDSYPLKWFKDSTDLNPFYAHNNYGVSSQYTTSQLFVDSTFFVRVNLPGGYPCESNYTPVHVNILPRNNTDLALVGLDDEGVVQPPAAGWVYMSYNEELANLDTIKVKVINYGLQPVHNFQVSYGIRPTVPLDAEEIIVTETCTDGIDPDGTFIYSFDSLVNLHDYSKTYRIRAWVKTNGDNVPQNDTSMVRLVKPKNGNNVYCSSVANLATSIDISRVQFANLDNPSNPSGVAYTNYTQNIPAAKLFKGIYDSIYVLTDIPSSMISEDETDIQRIGGYVRAYVDWNRNGTFEPEELMMSDTVITGIFSQGRVDVPADALNGHTRLRVIVWQGADTTSFGGCDSPGAGEVEDYLVNIVPRFDIDAELMKFVSPLEEITDVNNDVSVVLRNTGIQPLTSAVISWSVNDGDLNEYAWSGNLASGERQIVTLANIDVELGMNKFIAFVDLIGDENHSNDTVRRNSFIYKNYELTYFTDFEEEDGSHSDDFYPKNINPALPTNCWEFGEPASTNASIKEAYSGSNCWKTVLDGKYPANNESILYSPIFDIGLIKPDTLSFMMRRALSSGSYMYVDYTNWNGDWVRLGAKGDGYGRGWYNSDSNRFEGSQNWSQVAYSLNHLQETSNLGNKIQFRFVFKSGNATNDGVAIDDIYFKRALRAHDLGATKIELTPHPLPNYGTYYYPKVEVKNYGYDTVRNYQVCYTAIDMNIPICEQVLDVAIAPRHGTHAHTFATGRYVRTELPNPFEICAFTRLNPTDLYSDNDSICDVFIIGPLQRDAALNSINKPSPVVVANELIEVEIVVENLGIDPITQLPVAYSVSGGEIVEELIRFEPPLFVGQSYIYKFNRKYSSPYGSTNLKVWTGLEGDYYHDNDTLFLRVMGTSSTKDIEAREIRVDDFNLDYLGVQLTIANNSSVGIANIEVGYYINGDPSTTVLETYRLGNALPAGALGYHYFAATLPRANAPYSSICAFVNVPGDNNPSNDTTCHITMGYLDAIADTIYIEHTSNVECRVQLRARNVGTLGGPSTVKAYLVVDGDWSSPIYQEFAWGNDEPDHNFINFMTFDARIPRKDNRIYDVVAWIKYKNDYNLSNDTTDTYKVVGYIGLDGEIEPLDEFELGQNIPNPFNKSTKIPFQIPTPGKVRLVIMDNLGKLIYSENKHYESGEHYLEFNAGRLPQGVYYYTMEYDGIRKTKKMIIAN